MKLMLFLVAGSVLIWVGILALYVAASQAGSPTFSLETLGELSQAGHFGPAFQNWVFPLFMVGFGILAGLWPFHTWSPDGHVAAPTGVSMLHAGVADETGSFRHHPGGHGSASGGRRRLDAGADHPRYG